MSFLMSPFQHPLQTTDHEHGSHSIVYMQIMNSFSVTNHYEQLSSNVAHAHRSHIRALYDQLISRSNPTLIARKTLGAGTCIRSILWFADTALPGADTNEAGAILYSETSLLWEDVKVATFHCALLSVSRLFIKQDDLKKHKQNMEKFD